MNLLLFDVDGTLVLTGGAGIRAFNLAFEQLYGLQGAMEGVRAGGKTDPAIVREIFRTKLRRQATPEEVEALTKSYLQLLPEAVERSEGFRLMPGIPRLLELLAARSDVLLGLGTGNFEQAARIKLERAGLNRYFPFGGFGSDSEDRVQLVRIAIDRGRALLPSRPRDATVYVIGDTHHDIDCGRRNRAVTVAVATGSMSAVQLQAYEPDHLFPDLSIPEAFLRLLGG